MGRFGDVWRKTPPPEFGESVLRSRVPPTGDPAAAAAWVRRRAGWTATWVGIGAGIIVLAGGAISKLGRPVVRSGIVEAAYVALFAGLAVALVTYLIAYQTFKRRVEAERSRPATPSMFGQQQTPTSPPPPGWYVRDGDPEGIEEWWDGGVWTGHRRPRA